LVTVPRPLTKKARGLAEMSPSSLPPPPFLPSQRPSAPKLSVPKPVNLPSMKKVRACCYRLARGPCVSFTRMSKGSVPLFPPTNTPPADARAVLRRPPPSPNLLSNRRNTRATIRTRSSCRVGTPAAGISGRTLTATRLSSQALPRRLSRIPSKRSRQVRFCSLIPHARLTSSRRVPREERGGIIHAYLAWGREYNVE